MYRVRTRAIAVFTRTKFKPVHKKVRRALTRQIIKPIYGGPQPLRRTGTSRFIERAVNNKQNHEALCIFITSPSAKRTFDVTPVVDPAL